MNGSSLRHDDREMRQILQYCIDASRSVGSQLRNGFGDAEIVRTKSESSVDVVTKFDVEAEEKITEQLLRFDPSIPVVGEELSSGIPEDAQEFWLVDPIDGTGLFTRGIPMCTTMISFVSYFSVVAAAVYNFNTDDMCAAARGMGCWLNDETIRVSERSLKDSYVSLEIDVNKHRNNLEIYSAMQRSCNMFSSLNCGQEFILTASGALDGRCAIDAWGSTWDYAPAFILIEEAGGQVETLGKPFLHVGHKGFIAGGKALVGGITELLASLSSDGSKQ